MALQFRRDALFLIAGPCVLESDALNLRVHVPGVAPADARQQIVRLGDEVLGAIRRDTP